MPDSLAFFIGNNIVNFIDPKLSMWVIDDDLLAPKCIYHFNRALRDISRFIARTSKHWYLLLLLPPCIHVYFHRMQESAFRIIIRKLKTSGKKKHFLHREY